MSRMRRFPDLPSANATSSSWMRRSTKWPLAIAWEVLQTRKRVLSNRSKQSTPRHNSQNRPSWFVWNLVPTNHICTLTKFDVPKSMESSEIESKVYVTWNPISHNETNLRHQKYQNTSGTSKNYTKAHSRVKITFQNQKNHRKSIRASELKILIKSHTFIKFQLNVQLRISNSQNNSKSDSDSSPRSIFTFWNWWNRRKSFVRLKTPRLETLGLQKNQF